MAEKKKILIVEDYDDARELMVLWLRRSGYEITAAADGFEGLKKAVSESPDLIIMDLFMPRMDGREAISHLRDNPNTRNTPVILLTASNDLRQSVNTLREMRVCLMMKPISVKSLSVAIAQQLNGLECQASIGQTEITPALSI